MSTAHNLPNSLDGAHPLAHLPGGYFCLYIPTKVISNFKSILLSGVLGPGHQWPTRQSTCIIMCQDLVLPAEEAP